MSRKLTFVDLFERLLPAAEPGALNHLPMLATAFTLDGNSQHVEESFQTLTHSASNQGLRLIHRDPITAERVRVEFRLPGGERLALDMIVVQSRSLGEFQETQVAFADSNSPG